MMVEQNKNGKDILDKIQKCDDVIEQAIDDGDGEEINKYLYITGLYENDLKKLSLEFLLEII
jgi:hypothetical protein